MAHPVSVGLDNRRDFEPYFLVVKSISLGLYPPSAAFSQVQAPAGLEPHAQLLSGFTFSVDALSQVHSPAGRARQEQRGPVVVFSLEALSHEQFRADCLPQEHLACWAQTQVSPLPQQVEGLATSVAIFEMRVVR